MSERAAPMRPRARVSAKIGCFRTAAARICTQVARRPPEPPSFHRASYQDELLPRVRAERDRRRREAQARELYAACERAPYGWENR